MMPKPKDYIKMDGNMSPLTDLHALLSMKLSPKAAQGNNKFFKLNLV